MRIVAAGDLYWKFDKTKEYLLELKKGIILFSEGSLSNDKHPNQNWNINNIAELTKNLPMTIIGEANNRIQIINKGKIRTGQYTGDYFFTEKEEYLFADKIHNVSYNPQKKISVLSRICADGNTPHLGSEKVDLLLIPSGGIDWINSIDELIAVHGKNLKENSLIVQSDLHKGTKFIYSLKQEQFVGINNVGKQGDEFITYDF